MTDQNNKMKNERVASVYLDKKGIPTTHWTITDCKLDEPVYITVPPRKSLPVVFVPGIMGSNLKSLNNKPLWRLDGSAIAEDVPVSLAWKWLGENPKTRQKELSPQNATVDDDGNVPYSIQSIGGKELIKKRGWGTVGETSYMSFLVWLETQLNVYGAVNKNALGVRSLTSGATCLPEKPYEEITEVIAKKLAGWRLPVYAVGYNWLDSNEFAAERLKSEIERIIRENNGPYSRCEQVILVTHSMGGLVARACSELMGMREKIAGVVHGVMPAVGAAVAYRRCKAGMQTEDPKAAVVIGSTGRHVSAVFANSPGALQLLPTADYQAEWLKIQVKSGTNIETIKALPKLDPYEEIYKVKDKWWGLMREDWINPAKLKTTGWENFLFNIDMAKDFHLDLSSKYHPNTYVFYGDDPDQKSFTNIRWEIGPGGMRGRLPQDDPRIMAESSYEGTYDEALGSIALNSRQKFYNHFSDWTARCQMQDSAGDGTVPSYSGAAPGKSGGASVKQQFSLRGFGHEPAYKDQKAQQATLYAITKIAATAKVPS